MLPSDSSRSAHATKTGALPPCAMAARKSSLAASGSPNRTRSAPRACSSDSSPPKRASARPMTASARVRAACERRAASSFAHVVKSSICRRHSSLPRLGIGKSNAVLSNERACRRSPASHFRRAPKSSALAECGSFNVVRSSSLCARPGSSICRSSDAHSIRRRPSSSGACLAATSAERYVLRAALTFPHRASSAASAIATSI